MYKARKDRELMEIQYNHENKLLSILTTPLRIGDCAGGHRLENRGKNRDVMIVPRLFFIYFTFHILFDFVKCSGPRSSLFTNSPRRKQGLHLHQCR
jgi:hypothetical protein